MTSNQMIMKTADVSEIFGGVTRYTLRRWGLLPVRRGYYAVQDVNRLLQSFLPRETMQSAETGQPYGRRR